MALYITTTTGNSATLTDLGERIISAGTSDYNITDEFRAERLRTSISLATSIYNGECYIIDDYGKVIDAQDSLQETIDLLETAGILPIYTDRISAITSGNYYVGFNKDTLWEITKYTNDGSLTENRANKQNNGSYDDLTTAWTDRTTLIYN